MTRRAKQSKPDFMHEVPPFGGQNLAEVREHFGKKVSPRYAVASLVQGMQNRYKQLTDAPPEDQARWKELIDLQVYLDGGPDHSADSDNDPLPLIARLRDEGFITTAEARNLRRRFHYAVENVIGHKLDPEQVAAFRQLLREFDPTADVKAKLNADKFA